MKAIFHRALLRELIGTSAVVFGVLLGIITVTQSLHYLGRAAYSSLPTDVVAVYIGLGLLNYTTVILSLALFAGVLLTLARSYSDSEMVVWFSAGLSIAAWVRPVLYFAAPLVTLIALGSLFVSPWADAKREQYEQEIDSRDDMAAIAPRVFKESRHDRRVFFIEDWGPQRASVKGVFVQSQGDNNTSVMAAAEGYQRFAKNGDQFLVLLNGTRYEGEPGGADYRIMRFERYAVRVEPHELKQRPSYPESRTTMALSRESTPASTAELQWRVSLPLSGLLLALLAVPLAFVNPRAGRSLLFVVATLVYTIYNNLLGVSQAWIEGGRISPYLGVWWVHGAIAVLTAILFYKRVMRV
ncbi:MAG: LPS export ABC transporter permease LptF [Burkholderiales bacterium]